MASWAQASRATIERVHAALPADATPAERKRALREAYPFAMRSGWAYKAWLREQKKYLSRFPDVSKLKDSPLFRAARRLAPERKARPVILRYRDSGADIAGRYALFRCPRCKREKKFPLRCDEDKIAKHRCFDCSGDA